MGTDAKLVPTRNLTDSSRKDNRKEVLFYVILDDT